MPLGVALSELRYELRAEIYSSLLPAHGLSASTCRTPSWSAPSANCGTCTPGRIWTTASISTCRPTRNMLRLRRDDAVRERARAVAQLRSREPAAVDQLRYGFEDWINETLNSYPPTAGATWSPSTTPPA